MHILILGYLNNDGVRIVHVLLIGLQFIYSTRISHRIADNTDKQGKGEEAGEVEHIACKSARFEISIKLPLAHN